jgi:hypothetical protein
MAHPFNKQSFDLQDEDLEAMQEKYMASELKPAASIVRTAPPTLKATLKPKTRQAAKPDPPSTEAATEATPEPTSHSTPSQAHLPNVEAVPLLLGAIAERQPTAPATLPECNPGLMEASRGRPAGKLAASSSPKSLFAQRFDAQFPNQTSRNTLQSRSAAIPIPTAASSTVTEAEARVQGTSQFNHGCHVLTAQWI